MMEYRYYWDDNGNLCRFRVKVDDMYEGPRMDTDNVGQMMCWSRKYNLGDYEANDFRDEDDFIQEMYLNFVDGNAIVWDMDPRVMLRSICASEIVILPLYLLDHSGIAISTGTFVGHAMDTGRVGWIWAEKETIISKLGATEENWREKGTEALEEEVRIYDMYLENEVYWWCIESARKGSWDNGEIFFGDWERVESDGGFYSEKYGDALIRELATEAGLNPDGFYDSEEKALAAHAMPLNVREIA